MDNNSFEFFLQQALKEVEDKVGWGPGAEWKTQDFLSLSQQIENSTGVILSITTLKRLWGKVHYQSTPTVATLNALVRFIDYENWQAYKQSKLDSSLEEIRTTNRKSHIKTKPLFRWMKYGGVGLLILLGIAFIKLIPDTSDKLEAREQKPYYFTTKQMLTAGVPNSVIFIYDASKAAADDTIEIQQSWDKNLRKVVARDENIHKSIYYYPGYFQAKLVVNDEIVEEQDLYINTDGWLAAIERDNVPIYFDTSTTFNNGRLNIPLSEVEAHNVPLQPEVPWVSYFNVRNFGDLTTEAFTLETTIRNDYNKGSGVCQHSEIYVMFKGGVFMIPLAIKGCVSELEMYDVIGKVEDTSGLGCNLSDWVDVRFEVKDKKGKIYINGQLAYKNLSFTLPPLDIVGIRYRFQGSGSVRSVKLLTGKRIVYQDDFAR